MGTSDVDANNDTQFVTQEDRLWMEARQAEYQESESQRRWRTILLGVAICLVAGSVAVMMVLGGR
jgi:hypothetical protein